MKKIVLSLVAIASIVACTKECEECKKDCDLSQDSTCNCDTVYLPPLPDTSCQTDLAKDLLAYYPFNGNFNDESGNGNNATSMNGASLTTDYAGRTNSCAGFDGWNDYLIVPASSKLDSDTFTISLQVMLNSINRAHTLLARTNFENASATSLGLGVALPTDNKFNYNVVSNTEDCSVVHSYNTGNVIYGNSTIQPGRWYNLIISFANGVQKFYINGVLQASETRNFTKAKQCANANLVIGGWWKNGITSTDGKIDDVRLYKRVLTDCEINKLADVFKDAE